MKKFALLLILILCQTFVFGQTKVYEYEGTDSDTESAYVVSFVNALNKQPANRGLLVIYAGENPERLGNVYGLVKGLEQHIKMYLREDKVSVVVAQGKKLFYQEMWFIPEGAKPPEIKSVDFDFSNLKTKYFYAYRCLDCDPAVIGLSLDEIDFEHYADVLKKNNYQGIIDIYTNRLENWTPKARLKDALAHAGRFRRILTKEFGVKNKNVIIRIKKSTEKGALSTANLYIVPKAFKNKK